MDKLTIISLKKNEIVYSKKKTYKTKNLLFSFLLFLIIGAVLMGTIYYTGDFGSNVSSNIVKIYSNNANQNSHDYTFDDGEMVFKSTKNIKFGIPVKTSNFEIIGNKIKFVINESIMIKSIENGIIAEIGQNANKQKFIKIQHNDEIYSIIENFDVCGVTCNSLVKKGQDIATAKIGESIVLTIYINGTPISNLNIVKNEIIWEN